MHGQAPCWMCLAAEAGASLWSAERVWHNLDSSMQCRSGVRFDPGMWREGLGEAVCQLY